MEIATNVTWEPWAVPVAKCRIHSTSGKSYVRAINLPNCRHRSSWCPQLANPHKHKDRIWACKQEYEHQTPLQLQNSCKAKLGRASIQRKNVCLCFIYQVSMGSIAPIRCQAQVVLDETAHFFSTEEVIYHVQVDYTTLAKRDDSKLGGSGLKSTNLPLQHKVGPMQPIYPHRAEQQIDHHERLRHH